MSLTSLLHGWQNNPEIADNLPVWRTTPPCPAQTAPFPADLPHALAGALLRSGIQSLYIHQHEAWQEIRAGQNVILATGTASGKTLAYNLPVLAALLEDPQARALYLFPTKALAQDQLASLRTFGFPNLSIAIYDGDTPAKERPVIRRRARLLLSNPDMLHTGILPHHTGWTDFLQGLKFVLLDEAHIYRGVFGSHVANLLRRLKRIAAFYGTAPQFILTTATIGNPQEFAERLVEAPVHLIETDGSPRGPRHFLIYNPPVTDAALGLRKSTLFEAVHLTKELHSSDIQTLIFARSRRSVEMLLKYLQVTGRKDMRGYRSGYLPLHRRHVERGLREGTVRIAVATNALELGVDIGGLEAVVLVGYPGSISSTRQQAGRAGRRLEPSLALLVASSAPLDQYLVRHPDYFFERPPEQALINPNHLLILLNHLRCALFELPFWADDGFGTLSAEAIRPYLDFLVSGREAHQSQGRYYWMSDAYPAADVSLRSASSETIALQIDDDGRARILGTVDAKSAAWLVHPGAIYLHEAQTYVVEQLDLEQCLARLVPLDCDYYTEPLRQTDVKLLAMAAQEALPSHHKSWGELQVTSLVTGFCKRRWYTQENLGQEPLDLPPVVLPTTGYWLTLTEATIERLRASGAWRNDANNYGPGWNKLRDAIRARDGYRCQVCGIPEGQRRHDVHHRIPLRAFASLEQANRPENLITLCASCHRRVEENVRIRSGLAGLAYALSHLAPLFLMCDPGDLGTHVESAPGELGPATVVLYDLVPAGIGFSQRLFELHESLLSRALDLVQTCECQDGCPSCVGPGGENGSGSKAETMAILSEIVVK